MPLIKGKWQAFLKWLKRQKWVPVKVRTGLEVADEVGVFKHGDDRDAWKR